MLSIDLAHLNRMSAGKFDFALEMDSVRFARLLELSCGRSFRASLAFEANLKIRTTDSDLSSAPRLILSDFRPMLQSATGTKHTVSLFGRRHHQCSVFACFVLKRIHSGCSHLKT